MHGVCLTHTNALIKILQVPQACAIGRNRAMLAHKHTHEKDRIVQIIQVSNNRNKILTKHFIVATLSSPRTSLTISVLLCWQSIE